MAFIAVWMFVVYFPLAHMVWGVDGFMNGVWNAKAAIKAIDFAGGTVVHMSSGWSALILCLILGKRTGFGKRAFLPHSLVLTMVGTGMLWVGWYGFNAGSAVAVGRHRRQRLHHHDARHRGRRRGLAAARVDHARQAHRARLLLGRRRGPGRHHAGRRLRHPDERASSSACWPAWSRSSPAPS